MLFFEYDFEDKIARNRITTFLSDYFEITKENILSEEKYFDRIGFSENKFLGLEIAFNPLSSFKTQINISLNFELNEIERFSLGLKFAKEFNTKVITGDYLQRSEFILLLPNEEIKFIALNLRENSEIINLSFQSKAISFQSYVKQCDECTPML